MHTQTESVFSIELIQSGYFWNAQRLNISTEKYAFQLEIEQQIMGDNPKLDVLASG